MRVLITGQGGREHALIWKLAQSSNVAEIYAWPGNPGIFEIAKPVSKGINSLLALKEFAKKEKIDLTIVGPEKHLAAGIADLFQADGLRVFGPDQKAARLESSKAFAKAFMVRYGIPTARYFAADTKDAACSYINKAQHKLVIKADGLAQGKGVYVTDSKQEAVLAAQQLFGGAFGEAGRKVVIEERLIGPEISVFVFVHQQNYCLLPIVMDHKRAHDNDLGPNTGGMGAIAPISISKEIEIEIEKKIIKPTVAGLKTEEIDFCGVLFIGLMLTQDGPKVLEYNVRLGDPETQALMPLINNDLYQLITSLMDNKPVSLEVKEAVSCCVIVAAKGYPGEFQRDVPIKLPTVKKDQFIFHSGTELKEGQLVSAGGRVLSVVGLGLNLTEAKQSAYQVAKKVVLANKYYRNDIGENIIKMSKN